MVAKKFEEELWQELNRFFIKNKGKLYDFYMLAQIKPRHIPKLEEVRAKHPNFKDRESYFIPELEALQHQIKQRWMDIENFYGGEDNFDKLRFSVFTYNTFINFHKLIGKYREDLIRENLSIQNIESKFLEYIDKSLKHISINARYGEIHRLHDKTDVKVIRERLSEVMEEAFQKYLGGTIALSESSSRIDKTIDKFKTTKLYSYILPFGGANKYILKELKDTKEGLLVTLAGTEALSVYLEEFI